jgi:hypothetical protein
MTSARNDRNDYLPSSGMPGMAMGVDRTTGSMIAGVLLIVVGAFNVIHGLQLLNSPDFLGETYLYDNLDFWGWAFLVWGVLQASAGIAVTMARSWGVTLGIILATTAMIGWFFMVFAAPGSAIVAILLNLGILLGLLSTAER